MPKSPVTKLLERKGLKPEELTPEEKKTLEQWREVLKKGDLKAADVASFCDVQVKIIERQFKDLDRNPLKTDRLVLLHSVYSAIRDLIRFPQAEREALEKYLNSLV